MHQAAYISRAVVTFFAPHRSYVTCLDMYALNAYHVFMKLNARDTPKQYTIRKIPLSVDQCLRKRASATGKSFNQTVLDALAKGTGDQTTLRTDFDFLIGSMTKKEAVEIEGIVQEARKIDKELWHT